MRVVVACAVVLAIAIVAGLVLVYRGGDGPCLDKTESGKVCDVHNLPLQDDTIAVTYGLPMWYANPAMQDAIGKQFPYANTTYNDGCVPKDGPRKACVSFCPSCRKAEAAWLQARGVKGSTESER